MPEEEFYLAIYNNSDTDDVEVITLGNFNSSQDAFNYFQTTKEYEQSDIRFMITQDEALKLIKDIANALIV